MGAIGRIPGFRGRTGRLSYVGLGLLMAFAVASVGTLLGRPRDPSQGIDAVAAAGIALVAAMVWAIVCLNARRLRDAGLSPWWGLFPFVTGIIGSPIADEAARSMVTNGLNGAFMLILCLLPSRREDGGQAASEAPAEAR